MGDMIFIDKVFGQSQERSKRPVTVVEIVSHVCKLLWLKEEKLSGSGKDRRLSKVRAIAAWLVLDSGSLTLAELSKRVCRDSSTLSLAAKLLEKQAQTDTELRQLMKKIREELSQIPISQDLPHIPFLGIFADYPKILFRASSAFRPLGPSPGR